MVLNHPPEDEKLKNTWYKYIKVDPLPPPPPLVCLGLIVQGGQRFNAYGPVRLAQGAIDQWYKDVHASDPGMWRAGPACCSRDTISFHYVGPAEAKAMHTILHNREM